MNGIWITVPALIVLLAALLPRIRSVEKEEITETVRRGSSGRFLHLSHGYTQYEITGPESGPVVILVNGFSVPYYMWNHIVEPLSRSGFRVVRYNYYGRGLSDRPDQVYNRELFVTQLRELISGLNLKTPVHLVGTSMGGAVAAAFTADYPELVDRVIFIDPLWEPLHVGMVRTPLLGEYLAASFYIPAAPREQYQDFFRPELFPEWGVLFREQMHYHGFKKALISTAQNFLSCDPWRDFEKVARQGRKVLQMWGEEERTLRKEGALRLQTLLDSELSWVKNAGHLPHYEQPDIVRGLILDFLEEAGFKTLSNSA